MMVIMAGHRLVSVFHLISRSELFLTRGGLLFHGEKYATGTSTGIILIPEESIISEMQL